MSGSNGVTTRAFSLAPIKDLDDQTQIPVVVQTKQITDTKSLDKLHEPETFPVHIFYLVDISTSMLKPIYRDFWDTWKLGLAQNVIKTTVPRLAPRDIEHSVIPFDSNIRRRAWATTNDPTKIIDQLLEGAGGNSNIHSAFNEVISFLRVQQAKYPNHRNVVVLFSDLYDTCGNSDEKITELTQELKKLNCGTLIVPIGFDCNKQLSNKILQSVSFGGEVHIAKTFHDTEHTTFSTKTFPEFVKQVQTAPAFRIASFNGWFNRVINLMPSSRKVESEKIISETKAFENQLHYPAAVGFQNDGLSIGFVKPSEFTKAKIHLINHQSSSLEPNSMEEILITPLANATDLDIATKELIENAPKQVLANEENERKGDGSIKLKLEISPKPVLMDQTDFITLLPNKPLEIGRALDNAIIIGGTHTSRKHCQLLNDDGQIAIRDLGSSNGVHVNNKKIEPNQVVHLELGDNIKLGDVTITITAA